MTTTDFTKAKAQLRAHFLSVIKKEDIKQFFSITKETQTQFVNHQSMNNWRQFFTCHQNDLDSLLDEANPLNPPQEFIAYFNEIETKHMRMPVKSNKVALCFKRLYQLVLLFERIDSEIKNFDDVLKLIVETSNNFQINKQSQNNFSDQNILFWILVFCLMEFHCSLSTLKQNSNMKLMIEKMLKQLNHQIIFQYVVDSSEKRAFAGYKGDFESFLYFASYLFSVKKHKFQENYILDFLRALTHFLMNEKREYF